MKSPVSTLHRILSIGIFILVLLPSLSTALPVEENVEEVVEDDIDTNRTADADGDE